MEGQYNVLTALIVCEGDVSISGWEFKIRGYIANFCRHIFASTYLDLSALIGRPDCNHEIIPYYVTRDTTIKLY